LTILKVFIFANDDLNQTSLDMFLFKIGFTSLASEVENQKKILNKNTLAIEKLQKQINLLSDTNSKNKLSPTISINNTNSENTINNLNKEIILLKNRLKNVLNNNKIKHITDKNQIISLKDEKKEVLITKESAKKKSNFIKKLPYKYAKVNHKKLSVYEHPYRNSRVIDKLNLNTLIKIEYCNKFLWCKIYKEDAYVAKIRLNF
jgi:hypothetical protein